LSDAGQLLLQARWVAPMDRPILRDAGVLIQSERIVAVDSAAALRAQNPHAEVIDYPRNILLPGLVNAHTHLELSNCHCGPTSGGTFGDWIIGMRDRMKLNPQNIEPTITAAVRQGVSQCIRFGVTSVGDITSFIEISRATLHDLPLRVVSYGEALGLAKLRHRFETSIARAIDRRFESEHLHIGLSPHAPYTVDLRGYEECLRIAKQQHLPLATHLSENPQETDLLIHQTGMFREVWDKLGSWEDGVTTYSGSPIQFAKSIGLLDYPTLLAHVNYCDDAELNLLANGNASVVYCPRTHAYFGHPPHRWREMLGRGINVAVGTDSCASSPDLNLVDDLRLLRKLAPEINVEIIWQMGMVHAAKAVQMESEVGTLSVGKFADIIAFEIASNSPLEEILQESYLPEAVYLQGKPSAPLAA
jgi:aminodeoxyfutalosine deaminase